MDTRHSLSKDVQQVDQELVRSFFFDPLEVEVSFRGTANRLRREEKAGPLPACLKRSEDDSIVPVAHLSAYLPVAMSQTFNSPGSLAIDPPAEANILPSGLNATDSIAWVPWRVARSFPVATSQNLTVLS